MHYLFHERISFFQACTRICTHMYTIATGLGSTLYYQITEHTYALFSFHSPTSNTVHICLAHAYAHAHAHNRSGFRQYFLLSGDYTRIYIFFLSCTHVNFFCMHTHLHTHMYTIAIYGLFMSTWWGCGNLCNYLASFQTHRILTCGVLIPYSLSGWQHARPSRRQLS